MKFSNNQVRANRIKTMAFICMSIVAMGASATEALFHEVKNGSEVVSVPLDYASFAFVTRAGADILNNEGNFTKFVDSFQTQPHQFAEALKVALLARKDTLEDTKKSYREFFDGVKDESWGKFVDGSSQKEALKKLITAIIGDGKDAKGLDLAKLESSDFQSELFSNSDLVAALKLTKGKKTVVAKKESTGEKDVSKLTEEQLQTMAAPICAAKVAEQKVRQETEDQLVSIQDQMKAIAKDREELAKGLDKLALAATGTDERERDDRKQGALEFLRPLLSQLGGSKKESSRPVTPASNATNPLAMQQPQANNQQGDFSPQIPQSEQQGGTPGPLAGSRQAEKAPAQAVAQVQNSATKEVADARSATSATKSVLQSVASLTSDPYLLMGSMMGMGGMMGPVSPMFALLNLKRIMDMQNTVSSQLAVNQANLKNIDAKLAALDEKKGLSAIDQATQAKLKLAVDDREQELKSVQRAWQMEQDPTTKQSLAMTVSIKEGDLNDQKKELSKFETDKAQGQTAQDQADATARKQLEGQKSLLEEVNNNLVKENNSLTSSASQSKFAMIGNGQQQGRPNINGNTPVAGNGGPRGTQPQTGRGNLSTTFGPTNPAVPTPAH
ncbi:MAG: hypothetical protein HYR96_09295 [Deltaproteobacteria bacterium]|nr:hypothetical protein [Deltaproteobacteria bacterium]MBI3293579.1 hypothetical protein [Deltaproteobacteria bacterium]